MGPYTPGSSEKVEARGKIIQNYRGISGALKIGERPTARARLARSYFVVTGATVPGTVSHREKNVTVPLSI